MIETAKTSSTASALLFPKEATENKLSLLASISRLTQEVKAFTSSGSADRATRYEIRTAALALADSLEDPVEQAIRIVYETSPPTVALRVALEGGFLKHFDQGRSITAAQLSNKTGADHALIGLGHESFPFEISWDNVNIVFTKLTEYLVNTSFRNPDSYNMGPHTFTFGRPLWKRLELEPHRSKVFDNLMMAFKRNRENWVDIFPFNQTYGESLTPDQVLIVDVAGGIGHRLKDFKTKYPEAVGRAILQDLPHVIPSTSSNSEVLAGLQQCGIEVMEYDYYTPQPIYGARYYFFSAIFHGKADSDCLKLLLNTAPAMMKGFSRILINDFVLPERSANLFQASMDLWMMAEVSGRERGRKECSELLEAANVRIIEVYRLGTDSVLEIELSI